MQSQQIDPKVLKLIKTEHGVANLSLTQFETFETVSSAAKATIVDHYGSVTECDFNEYHRACLLQFPSSAKSALVEFSKENQTQLEKIYKGNFSADEKTAFFLEKHNQNPNTPFY